GQSLVSAGSALGLSPGARVTFDDGALVVGCLVVGAVWWWLRQGRVLPDRILTRATLSIALGVAIVVAALAIVAAIRVGMRAGIPRIAPASVIGLLAALGSCLFVMGTSEGLGSAVTDFPQPKIFNLRRAVRIVNAQAAIIAASALAFAVLVPEISRATWRN